MPISSRNSEGFTLVELVVAMGIILVSLFAVLKAVEVGSENNIRNMKREEAVRVAEEKVAYFQALPFSAISTPRTYPDETVKSRFRGYSSFAYTVVTNTQKHTTNSVPPVNSMLIDIRVRWKFKNTSTTQGVVFSRTP